MANTILCPHCKRQVELSDAFKHQIEEEVKEVMESKHLEEIASVRQKVAEEASKKAQAEFETLIKSLKQENEEQQSRSSKLQQEILELTKEMRKARQDAEEERVRAQRTIAQEEEKIRLDAKRKAEEESSLLIAQKEKRLTDALKANEILKQKLEQGSQQTQGEVLELELEELLKKEFPTDEIKPVPKGIRGADVIQVVVDRVGRKCGMILWESKNAKWSEVWLAKLKEDQRVVNADTAVLVSVNVPEDITTFKFKSGIWVTTRTSVVGLASVLRTNIGQVFHAKLASEGKNEKMEVLFNYLTSNEFVHRIETMFEVYQNQRADLEKEKRWFTSKWAKQEKDIDRGIRQISGMHGELEGLLGTASMPQVKGLEMMELESGE